MPLILYVLHVAGSAIGFVGSNRLAPDARIGLAQVALSAGSPRSRDVDRIERHVTTRARQIALLVAEQSVDGFHAIKMHSVKLLAAPLIFDVAWQPLQLQSFLLNSQLFIVHTGPFPVTIDHRIAKRAA